jgi:hypothetical protein
MFHKFRDIITWRKNSKDPIAIFDLLPPPRAFLCFVPFLCFIALKKIIDFCCGCNLFVGTKIEAA